MGRGRPGGAPENLTNKGKGRVKGSKNKFTSLKDDILKAYQKRGGLNYMQKLPDQYFTRFISDLLPKKVETEHSGEVSLIVNIIKSGEGKM